MIEIHKVFKKEEFRFCPLKPFDKISFTDHNTYNYKYNDETLNSYLKNDYNYGIMIGYGFDLLIDIDNEITYNLIKNLLIPTLEQTSATKKLPHLFYKCNFKINKSRQFEGIADFFTKGKYVVGSNSIIKGHIGDRIYTFNGDNKIYTYVINKDLPIAYLPEENFYKILEIVEKQYNKLPVKKAALPKKINPNIIWFGNEHSKRYFKNEILITDIQKLYRNKTGQYVFNAIFSDTNEKISFSLNRPTENKLLDILIKGKNKAIFYTIIDKSKYMRQIKEYNR